METHKAQRTFIIGDNWLYYKIYTGAKTSELILTESIRPVVEELLKNNIIQKWFFIRYSDPHYHIRIRIYLNNTEHIGKVIRLLKQSFKLFIDEDLIWKIQIETYQRELERYGISNIVNSENMFFIDSVMMLKLFNVIVGDKGEEIRWLFGIKAIDSLLNSFMYDENRKRELLEHLKESFGQEFGMSRSLKKQLDIKFREENERIENFLDPKNELNSSYLPLYKIIIEKELMTKEIVGDIIALKDNNYLEIELDFLISSYIHMLMNRLFRTKNRMHEMVIYDFMFRIYNSRCARKKYTKKFINS